MAKRKLKTYEEKIINAFIKNYLKDKKELTYIISKKEEVILFKNKRFFEKWDIEGMEDELFMEYGLAFWLKGAKRIND